jgi:FAD synthase
MQKEVVVWDFWGVHLGHKKIIRRLIQNAQDLESARSLLLTFSASQNVGKMVGH